MKHAISYLQFEHFSEVEQLFRKNSDQIKEYVDQLLWWNNRLNLISRDVSRETVVEHVRHSLCISQSEVYKSAANVVDAGTGGGLPGIPLAIVNEEIKIILNDVVSKKIMACKQMIYKLKLKNCSTKDGSIENVDLNDDVCIISKHAFKINDLINLLKNKPVKEMVLLKGNDEVVKELKGLAEELTIKIYSLEQEKIPFYTGKAMVEIIKN